MYGDVGAEWARRCGGLEYGRVQIGEETSRSKKHAVVDWGGGESSGHVRGESVPKDRLVGIPVADWGEHSTA